MKGKQSQIAFLNTGVPATVGSEVSAQAPGRRALQCPLADNPLHSARASAFPAKRKGPVNLQAAFWSHEPGIS